MYILLENMTRPYNKNSTTPIFLSFSLPVMLYTQAEKIRQVFVSHWLFVNKMLIISVMVA